LRESMGYKYAEEENTCDAVGGFLAQNWNEVNRMIKACPKTRKR
jgi:hypothetical protein